MICFDKSRSNIGRLNFLRFVVVVAFGLLAVLWRQYFCYNLYDKLNQRQCLRRILYPGQRGRIYDRFGNVLADNKDSYCLYVDLNYFRTRLANFSKTNKDSSALAEQLWALVHDALLPYSKKVGPIPFNISKKTIYTHYQQNALLPLAISKHLTKQAYASLLETLPVDGPFQVGVEKIRHYPYGRSACHVIGYVTRTPQLTHDNLPGEDLRTFFLPKQKGKTGVEAYYDDQLSGLNGGDIWRVSPSGQEQDCLISLPSKDGDDIHLTLDIHLQQVCEQALKDRQGSVIVLDVNSGDVLSLVSKPDFDLNQLTPSISRKTFQEITEQGAWLNRAIQGLYPPGSTFKLISLSALMKSGVVNEHSQFTCEGSYLIGNRTFHCHNRQGHGLLDVTRAIQTSCNPFIYHFALACGPTRIYQEACEFGLNSPTKIDLPYETSNTLVPSETWKKNHLYESWTDGDTANFSIGQGFLRITPLQLPCVAASLAKNQKNLTPHVCLDAPIPPTKTKPLMPEKNWQLLLKGMESSVEAGTSRFAYIQGLKSAVKTGTSQVKIAGTHTYAHIGWLIGFAPVQAPKIAFCIMIEQKDLTENFWGSHVCGPVAREILQFCIDQGIISKS